MAMDELSTALFPIGPDEHQWAHNRPMQHRIPLPMVGDEVFYRHRDWEEPTRAEVLAIQNLDDLSDPHLWHVETDPFGQPVLLEGRHVIVAKVDPWPTLTLRTVHGVGLTREARLRGSPGWLPLDWRTRYRPLPTFTIVR